MCLFLMGRKQDFTYGANTFPLHVANISWRVLKANKDYKMLQDQSKQTALET